MRRIVLDTETTGICKNDRIIEIGAVELEYSPAGSSQDNNAGENRNTEKKGVFHYYLNPQKKIHPDAIKVHGISDKFLEDKPLFSTVAEEFEEFIRDATLIIHNAPFDLYYLNFELALLAQEQRRQFTRVEDLCLKVEDTLVIAQSKYPGQSNSLDALLARLGIDSSARAKGHGALIDARLLGGVYESMCLTQSGLDFNVAENKTDVVNAQVNFEELGPFRVIKPSAEELAAHNSIVQEIGIVTDNS